MSVSAKSKEAFWLGVAVPIPTLTLFVVVTPPNTILLLVDTVAPDPIATEYLPMALVLAPKATETESATEVNPIAVP